MIEAWLVVAAIDDNADDGETHSYQFRFVEPVEEVKGGCSTVSSGAQSLGWVALGVLALTRRRNHA